jgi:hypothetical protein
MGREHLILAEASRAGSPHAPSQLESAQMANQLYSATPGASGLAEAKL